MDLMKIKSVDDFDVNELKQKLEFRDGAWVGYIDDVFIHMSERNGIIQVLEAVSRDEKEKFEYFDSMGEMWNKFDDEGRVIYKKTILDSFHDGKSKVEETEFEYDDDDRITKEIRREDGEIFTIETSEYDGNGRMIYQKLIGRNGEKRLEYIVKQNEYGNTVYKRDYHIRGRDMIDLYEYDDKQRVILHTQTDNGKLNLEEIVTYNKDGSNETYINNAQQKKREWEFRDENNVLIQTKEQNLGLKDFEYFADLIDTEKAPIRIVNKYSFY